MDLLRPNTMEPLSTPRRDHRPVASCGRGAEFELIALQDGQNNILRLEKNPSPSFFWSFAKGFP